MRETSPKTGIPLRHQLRVRLFLMLTLVMGVVAVTYAVVDINRQQKAVFDRTHRTLSNNMRAMETVFQHRMEDFYNRVVTEADTNAMLFAPGDNRFEDGSGIPYRYKYVWLEKIICPREDRVALYNPGICRQPQNGLKTGAVAAMPSLIRDLLFLDGQKRIVATTRKRRQNDLYVYLRNEDQVAHMDFLSITTRALDTDIREVEEEMQLEKDYWLKKGFPEDRIPAQAKETLDSLASVRRGLVARRKNVLPLIPKEKAMARLIWQLIREQGQLPQASGLFLDPTFGGYTVMVAEKTITDRDEITGYLVGLLNLDALRYYLKRQSTLAQTALVAHTGAGPEFEHLLFNSNQDTPDAALMQRGESRLSGLRETLTPATSGALMLRRPVELGSGLSHLKFDLISYEPSAKAHGEILAHSLRVGLYAFFLWLGTAVLAWVVAGRFSRHLTQISGLAHDIAVGREDTTVPLLAGHDEISRLFQSIHDMKNQLDERQAAELKAKREAEHARDMLKAEHYAMVEVQRSMLPPEVQRFGTYEIARYLEETAGKAGREAFAADLIGTYFTKDNRIAVGVGDISGSGGRAGLAMAWLHGFTAEEVLRNEGGGPAQIMHRLNLRLLDTIGKVGLYGTLLLGVFQADGSSMRYSTAGHPPPLIFNHKSGLWREADGTGSPLGLVEDVSFGDYLIKLSGGDIVVFFTDGLFESENALGQRLEVDHIVSLLNENKPASAEETMRLVSSHFKTFLGSKSVSDDVALVAVCREDPEEMFRVLDREQEKSWQDHQRQTS